MSTSQPPSPLALSSILPPSTHQILSTASARLYHAPLASRSPSSQMQWTSSGLRGILVFGRDADKDNSAGGHAFRLVDEGGCKVVWACVIPPGTRYGRDKPFFHFFSGVSRQYGFRFDEDDEADAFFDAVTRTLSPSKPPAGLAKKKRSFLRIGGRRVPVISPPSPGSFVHLTHVALDEKGFVGMQEGCEEWMRLVGPQRI